MVKKFLMVGLVVAGLVGCGKREIVDIAPNEVAYVINNFADKGEDSSQKFDGTREDWSQIRESSKMIVVEYQRVSTGSIPIINSRKIPQKRIVTVSQGIFTKDYVADLTRGTDDTNQSFKAESSNGAEFSVGLTLSAKIKDTDTYLSIYGMNPNASIKDVQVEAIDLGTILDRTIRPYIQGELSAEFSKYQTFDIQPKKNDVIKAVAKRTAERFAKDGIEILTFNSSDTITWSDKKIQLAINEKAQLEAEHQKAIVEQEVSKKEAETKRLVLEQQAMADKRRIELSAEAERSKAEIDRLKALESNKQKIDLANAEVEVAKAKAKTIDVESKLLDLEKKRVELKVKEMEAQAKLNESLKWNGVMPLSNVTVQGASAIVDKNGKVQTVNFVK